MVSAGIITAITGLAKTGLGIVDQMVEDKDLKQRLAIKNLELTYGLIEKLLNTTTIPWVDATVKLISTLIVFARPVGCFLISCAGFYMHFKGIEINEIVHYGMDSAFFPTWTGAREIHKHREEKSKRIASAYTNIPRWE